MSARAILAAALTAAWSCSAAPEPPPVAVASAGATTTAPATADANPAALPPPPAVARPARVDGTAPEPADDVPAVVVLEPATAYAYPPPTTRPLMDQVATRFTPAAIVVRTGQTADFRNDDDKMHNVRVRERGRPAEDLAFNVALAQGTTYDFTFRKDAAWDVRCDMHQSMYGLVVSTSSPYTAVAAADRSFVVEGLPPGDYTAVAYTSRDRIERRITLAEGQSLTLDFGASSR